MFESKRKQQKFLMIDPLRPCTLKAILGHICIRKWLLMAVWKAKVRARTLHLNHQAFIPTISERRCTCARVHRHKNTLSCQSFSTTSL